MVVGLGASDNLPQNESVNSDVQDAPQQNQPNLEAAQVEAAKKAGKHVCRVKWKGYLDCAEIVRYQVRGNQFATRFLGMNLLFSSPLLGGLSFPPFVL